MDKISKILILIIIWNLNIAAAQAQNKLIKINVTPDSKDWNYKLNQQSFFEVTVTRDGKLIQDDFEISYELSNDMMNPHQSAKVKLENGRATIKGGTMKKPGFLRCRVFLQLNEKKYEGRATAGFNPELIKPTVKMPVDFLTFWKNSIIENQKIPMNPNLRLLPEKCTDKIKVFELSFNNYRTGSKMYGILCVPKAPGKYPAFMRVPGAGVTAVNGDIKNAEKGAITLSLAIHGIPVTMQRNVYADLVGGALYQYGMINFDNKDNVYYKRVYLGCVRAVDYIFSMPEFDGENLIVHGGSQGGALSIVTAALDSRVKACVSFYPALSDMTGYLNKRAGGWPHLFRNSSDSRAVLAEKAKISAYYDVVNFARLLSVPVFYGFGYNDMVCPPTTSFSVYNVITSVKTICIKPEIDHYAHPEMWGEAWKWAYSIVGLQTVVQEQDKCQSLFSSMNDTVSWRSSRTEFFPTAGWVYKDGELTLTAGRKGGDLITRKQYTDFELSLEFKLTKKVNSGVKYFVNRMTDKSTGKISWIGFEYQIIDDFSGEEIPSYEGAKGSTGALYLIYEPIPEHKKLKPVGEWNSMRIVVIGKRVEHWLNGKKVIDVNIESDDFKKRVSETKFANYEAFGKMNGGHILLQDHGNEITYRNIVISENSKNN